MRLRLLGALLALGLVTGCGGSSHSGSASTPQPTARTTPVIQNPASASAAVVATKEYLDAFLGGRAERVCALETRAFIARQIENAVAAKLVRKGSSCVEFVKGMVAISKKADPRPATRAFEVSALEANDREATVRVNYPQSPGTNPDSYVLVKSGDRWLVDSNP